MAKVNKLMNGWGPKSYLLQPVIASEVGILIQSLLQRIISLSLGTAEIPILPTESTVTPLTDVYYRFNLLLLKPRVFHLGCIQCNQLSLPSVNHTDEAPGQ